MGFPIVDLLDVEESLRWIEHHFHPEGLHCPRCQAPVTEARVFRRTQRSGLTVYRCKRCGRTYNVYAGTVFEPHPLTPPQVVLLLGGIAKGESSRTLAAELGIGDQTVLTLRHEIPAQAERLQPETPLPDQEVEADEMFQNAGEKGEPHLDPADPPRRRGVGTEGMKTTLPKEKKTPRRAARSQRQNAAAGRATGPGGGPPAGTLYRLWAVGRSGRTLPGGGPTPGF